MTLKLDKSRLPWYFVFGLIVFLYGLFSHLFLLTSIPGPIVFDEGYYATEALAIKSHGSDVFGQWRPWYLTAANPTYSELTGLVQALGFLLIPNTPVLAIKILPAVFGALIPLLSGFFIWKVTHNQRLTLITALITTVNPWLFQFSRMAFDSFFGLFFILLGLTMLIALAKYWKLLSFLPLFLGFFQYQGYKIIFLPLVLFVGIWTVINSTQTFKKTDKIDKRSVFSKLAKNSEVISVLIVVLLSGILTLWFSITLQNSAAGIRVQEFIWSDVENISDLVNDQRRLATPSPLLNLASNKVSIIANQIWLQTLNAMSPVHYFGKASAAVDTFAVHQHGFLYPIDAVLFMIGFGVLWFAKIYKKSSAVLLSSLLLISFLPSILKIDQTWITFRGGFTIIFGLMVVAVGLDFVLFRAAKLVGVLLICFYLLLVLNFFYHYFFRYPAYSTHNLMYSNRVLSSYIQRAANQSTIFTNEPEILFSTLLFLGNNINKTSIKDISSSFQNETYQFDNFKIKSGCISNQVFGESDSTIIVGAGYPECKEENSQSPLPIQYPNKKIHLVTPFDSGTAYTIYNDKLCEKSNLNTFVRPFPPWHPIEKLSNDEFCRSFFVKDLVN